MTEFCTVRGIHCARFALDCNAWIANWLSSAHATRFSFLAISLNLGATRSIRSGHVGCACDIFASPLLWLILLRTSDTLSTSNNLKGESHDDHRPNPQTIPRPQYRNDCPRDRNDETAAIQYRERQNRESDHQDG